MYKKTNVKSLLATVLALILLSGCLVSCGSDKTVLTCNNIELTEGMYRYWYKQLKEYYVESYTDVKDSTEFWNSPAPNMDITYGEFIDDKIRTQIDYYLAGNELFEEYNIDSVMKTEWKAVRSAIDEEINDAVSSFGSRAAFDADLEEEYGINTDVYRTVRLMEQKYFLVYTYLYDSETGIDLATDEEIESFFQNSYARIKYYMVLKNYEYRVDDKGNRVMDSTGSYIQDALTEEEKQEKVLYTQETFAAIKDGTDIDVYIKKDYPDIMNSAPRGYYILKNEYYGYLFTSTVVNAAFNSEVGETVLCENEDAYFIVQRLPLEEKAYTGTDKGQFSSIADYAVNDKFEERFMKVIDTIQRDEEALSQYSVLTVN